MKALLASNIPPINQATQGRFLFLCLLNYFFLKKEDTNNKEETIQQQDLAKLLIKEKGFIVITNDDTLRTFLSSPKTENKVIDKLVKFATYPYGTEDAIIIGALHKLLGFRENNPNQTFDDFFNNLWAANHNNLLTDYDAILKWAKYTEKPLFTVKLDTNTEISDANTLQSDTITALFHSLEHCFESDLGIFGGATYIVYGCFTYGNANSSGISSVVIDIKENGDANIKYLRGLKGENTEHQAKCFRKKEADVIYLFEWMTDEKNKPNIFSGILVIDISPLRQNGFDVFKSVMAISQQNRDRLSSGRLYFIKTTEKKPQPKDYIGEQVFELKKKHPEIIDFFINDINVNMESPKFFQDLNLINYQETIQPKMSGLWYTCYAFVNGELKEGISIHPMWFHQNGKVELKGKEHIYYGTILVQNKNLLVIGFTERLSNGTNVKEPHIGFYTYIKDHNNNSFPIYSGGHLVERTLNNTISSGREILLKKEVKSNATKETFLIFQKAKAHFALINNSDELEKLNQEFRNVVNFLMQEKSYIVIENDIFDKKQRTSNNPFIKHTEYALDLFFAACGQAKYNTEKALEKLAKAFIAGFDDRDLLKKELESSLSVLKERIDIEKLKIR